MPARRRSAAEAKGIVVGAGKFGWMLVLAAAMTGEKNLPWGCASARRLA